MIQSMVFDVWRRCKPSLHYPVYLRRHLEKFQSMGDEGWTTDRVIPWMIACGYILVFENKLDEATAWPSMSITRDMNALRKCFNPSMVSPEAFKSMRHNDSVASYSFHGARLHK